MQYTPIALAAILAATSLPAAEIFFDDFSSYTHATSIAGSNWDPKYDDSDTTQRDLLTGHTDGYAVLNTTAAKLNYHAPSQYGFTVGNSGGSAIIKTDFRYLHDSGGDITTNVNKAAFGLLISTSSNWEAGTNKGLTICNRDGGVIGNNLPVAPWVQGSVSHTSLGVDTSTGGLSHWITIELSLSDVDGTLWAQATLTDKDTATLLYTTAAFSLDIPSTTEIYAGISTHWNGVGTTIREFSKFSEVHIDNFSVEAFSAPIEITVHPTVSASIGGQLQLDRSQFINICDVGNRFEGKINNQAQVDYYIDDLDMHFGRELGGVYTATKYSGSAIQEDPNRPGYVDLTHFDDNTTANNGNSSQAFRNKFSPNLGSATHDRTDAYPSFMPMWYDGSASNHGYPVNTDAAAEFATAVLEHRYTDWTRPATYEIVNEPDWRIWDDQRLADLHTAIKTKVNAAGLDVDIGGPCMAVAYYYKNNYQQFNLKDFIDNTNCDLDFYSFHVYDFMGWDVAANDFEGRVSTGLPIEGVLDLVQNYTTNQYSKEVPIVLSEHGGYISNDQEGALDTVANTYFPGSGFAWELKRRSVSEFLAVSSAIANTMAFMNNPHVIQKSVPFILLESAAWDTRYYSTLLVKEDFNANSNIWHESAYVNFYKFYKNVSGRRVRIEHNDPDIQAQAYVNGDKLYLLLNNLARKAEGLSLSLPTSGIEQITLRRFGRNADFTPYFTETTTTSLDGISIAARESITLEIDYSDPIIQQTLVDEVPHYGNLIQQSFSGSRSFNVAIPDYSAALYATLRIGVARDTGSGHQINVSFNGTDLTVPLEDCANYLEDSEDYASTKLINVPVNLLQANNTIAVSFPSGSGGIGAVVVRAAIDNTVNQAPEVEAGSPLELETPTNVFTLNGTVLDDALPVGVPVTSQWTQLSGPMPATIAHPSSPTTSVTCYFEGSYTFQLTANDGEYVSSDTVTVTISEPLTAESLTLYPIQDAYIENETTLNNSDLRIEQGSRTRTSYLKFQIPEINGSISAALLNMTVTTDPGSGTLRSHIGSHNDWLEGTLSSGTAPNQTTEADSYTGTLSGTQSFDLTGHITSEQQLTVILSMDSGGNDVSYGSRESGASPELRLTIATPDSSDDLDTDGMLDSWEKAHFGSILLSDGTRNQDADSLTDADEYIAGTDPTDTSSTLELHVSNDPVQTDRMRLEWHPIEGRYYHILWTPNLSTPFKPLVENLVAPQSSHTDLDSHEASQRFYQIEVELQTAP